MASSAQNRQPSLALRGFASQDHVVLPSAADGEAPAQPAVDLRALAERVYALLCQEARLERERWVGRNEW